LEPGTIQVNVRLGFLLAPLKYRLEQEIHRELNEGFGPAPDPA
ncbi:MAG TPA: hypothetical protein DEP36_02555, partial [Gammaproteobacteria bacterium]|nr:hypothetical protein [Gammaproteobacteria bacterium]